MKYEKQPKIRFMSAAGDTPIDRDNFVDKDGVLWSTVDGLRRRADAMEAERAVRDKNSIFKRPDIEHVSSEVTPEGGVLDAMAESVWAKRLQKPGGNRS